MITTTLAAIKAEKPCADRYRAFVRAIERRDGKLPGDDTPFPLQWALDLGSWDDAIWCLRLTPKIARLFAADCAEHVIHLFQQQRPADTRPRHAIETARRYACGLATDAEQAAARAAAWDAARAAARAAAWDAARDAAWDAARDAETVWQRNRLSAYWAGHVPAPLAGLTAGVAA